MWVLGGCSPQGMVVGDVDPTPDARQSETARDGGDASPGMVVPDATSPSGTDGGMTPRPDVPIRGPEEPLGDCASESGLADRSDLLFCEPWEEADWWSVHDFRNADRRPATADTVGKTELVTDDCVSGSCLRVHMRQYDNGSLSLKWLPLESAAVAPERLYMRYYLRLSPGWSGLNCDSSGTVRSKGGKFPGLAHETVPSDPQGQCGNGGEYPDPPPRYPDTPDSPQGTHCWSLRTSFSTCLDGGHDVCDPDAADISRWGDQLPEPAPTADVRLGSYFYFPGQSSYWGTPGYWDRHPWSQFSGAGGTCDTEPNNMYCGRGNVGMLEDDRWYAIEVHVEMNTPGVPDGVLRTWVDGELGIEKTNVIYRLEGHDDIHARTVWLNVYMGGSNGNCQDQYVDLDQLVVATDAPIGLVP